jgi:hypothetical protein
MKYRYTWNWEGEGTTECYYTIDPIHRRTDEITEQVKDKVTSAILGNFVNEARKQGIFPITLIDVDVTVWLETTESRPFRDYQRICKRGHIKVTVIFETDKPYHTSPIAPALLSFIAKIVAIIVGAITAYAIFGPFFRNLVTKKSDVTAEELIEEYDEEGNIIKRTIRKKREIITEPPLQSVVMIIVIIFLLLAFFVGFAKIMPRKGRRR